MFRLFSTLLSPPSRFFVSISARVLNVQETNAYLVFDDSLLRALSFFAAKITPAEVREAQAEDKRKITEKVENAAVKGEKEVHKQLGKAVVKETENSEKTAPSPDKKLKPEKKKKAKETKEDATLTFPVNIRINDYGFIGVRKGLLEALDWRKGMALKLDKNADGSVTVRKA